MGRIFLKHPNSMLTVGCKKCGTAIASREDLESGGFRGQTGKAYLYKKAVNLQYGDIMGREMSTGFHFVRDAHCTFCGSRVGWFYEYAKPAKQRHKEGKIILEQALIKDTK